MTGIHKTGGLIICRGWEIEVLPIITFRVFLQLAHYIEDNMESEVGNLHHLLILQTVQSDLDTVGTHLFDQHLASTGTAV